MLLESVNYLFYHLIFFVYYYNLLMVPKILLGLEAIFPEADISYIFTVFIIFQPFFLAQNPTAHPRLPSTLFHPTSRSKVTRRLCLNLLVSYIYIVL